MHSARILRTIAFVLVALALFYGVLELFLVRYEDPTSFPEYSSLRSDPLGTRAFFGALTRIDGVTASRNRVPLDFAELPSNATLLFAAARVTPDPVRLLERIEDFVERGGRLVIAQAARNDWAGGSAECGAGQPTCGGQDEDTPAFARTAFISERWGFAYDTHEGGGGLHNAVIAPGNKPELTRGGFPRLLPWRGGLYFTALDPAWRIRYTRAGKVVLMDRKWGEGSIVLASDTYFLSNEAMRDDRHPGILAWLAGPHRQVIFDETHLGMATPPGIIDLIYRLRLQGFLAVLGVLGALYAWMSLMAPVPRRETTVLEFTAKTRGREAFSGMVSLLRRSVPPAELLTRCHAEWKDTLPLLGPRAKSAADEVEQAVFAARGEADHGKIVESYRRLCRVNQEKR